jgi:NAD(P)-dependent dehydrogenase (short-subunit alcohol dehydrogenase family)
MKKAKLNEKKSLFDLSGRVALVTAGGQGLGREFCLAMAEFGADVVCDDIDIERAEETTGMVKSLGCRAVAIKADVSQQDQVEAMVDQTVAEMGKIDTLIANAGTTAPNLKIHEQPVEDWDKVMAISLRSTFLCIRAVIPVMLRQQKGAIITVSSVSGITAGLTVSNSAPYGAAKAGVIGLTRHAAVQYAREGIRVNTIVPGVHHTPLPSSRFSQEDIDEIDKELTRLTPMGRVGNGRELRGLAVYLASDASSYVTGQTFIQDGGRTA